jgi:uncharacterized protein YndB with AHSA1/START domain
MFVSDAEIDVKRPVGEVFAFLSDPANYARWMSNIKQVSALSPLAAGQPFQSTSYFEGQQENCAGVVEDMVEDSRIVLRATRIISGPGLLPAWTFTLTPTDDGTRLHWRNEVSTRGKMRFLELFYPRTMFDDLGRDCLFALKYILEK